VSAEAAIFERRPQLWLYLAVARVGTSFGRVLIGRPDTEGATRVCRAAPMPPVGFGAWEFPVCLYSVRL